MALPPVTERLYENQKPNLYTAKPMENGRWAGSRETNLDSGRSGTFFLDIPFYRTSLFIELIDTEKGEEKPR
jgi:hypothetical protein